MTPSAFLLKASEYQSTNEGSRLGIKKKPKRKGVKVHSQQTQLHVNSWERMGHFECSPLLSELCLVNESSVYIQTTYYSHFGQWN